MSHQCCACRARMHTVASSMFGWRNLHRIHNPHEMRRRSQTPLAKSIASGVCGVQCTNGGSYIKGFDDVNTFVPKVVWRMSNVLASKAVFDAPNSAHNPWSYASTESARHTEQMNAWLRSHAIPGDIRIFVVRGPQNITELRWSELIRDWAGFFTNEDVRIIDRDYSWIVDYRKEHIIRFGRLRSSNQPGAVKGGTALVCQAEHVWPAVTDPDR
jgi:hypothetical protein